jgi:hypothetical protein
LDVVADNPLESFNIARQQKFERFLKQGAPKCGLA